jgi:hypothetical protein
MMSTLLINNRFDRKTAGICLTADLILIVISIESGLALVFGAIETWPDLFNIGRDWSLGEIFNYLKWLLIIAILFRAYLQDKALLFLMMSLFFCIVLTDDALQLHERGSSFLILRSGLHLAIGSVAFLI